MSCPPQQVQRYADRQDGGSHLARRLEKYAGRKDVVVLALPRGGVPVASAVATALDAPLDIYMVRKLGVPGHAELAMGAIATGGVRVLNDEVVAWHQLTPETIESVTHAEQEELERRERAYRRGRPPTGVKGKVALLVDDGLATGATMRAAVLAVRQLRPSRVVVAAPVGAREASEALGAVADEVICPYTPEPFSAVGLWYAEFPQTTDEEVCRLLAASGPADDAHASRRF